MKFLVQNPLDWCSYELFFDRGDKYENLLKIEQESTNKQKNEPIK